MSRAARLAATLAAILATTLALVGTPFGGAAAQTVSATFAPGCDPAAGCSTARFTLGAPAGGLALTTLTLTFDAGPYRFVDLAGDPAGGTGAYAAADDLAPFTGFTTLSGGGIRLFVDFLDTGDPANPGFPFTLGGGAAGYLEVAIAPVASAAPFQFQYEAALAGGGTIGGSVGGPVSAVPEPGTWSLVCAGLLALGGVTHRRRGACVGHRNPT